MKKQVKRISAALMAAGMMAALMAGCGSSTSSSSSAAASTASGSTGGGSTEFPTMNIQLGHVNPTTDDDQYHKFAVLFTEKVTEATNGAVTFDICGNSELGSENDVLTGFDLGTHEVAIISNLALANVYGPCNVVEMPFMFTSNEQAWDFVDGDLMKEVTDGLYEDMGYKVLGYAEGGFRNVLSQKPIRTPEDMVGMKIRVPESQSFLSTFTTLGANPTPMAFSEVFTACQQGTIDGLELPIVSAYTGSYYEVCSYYDMTGHFYNAIGMVCSRSFWESLSPELQEIFQQAADEAKVEQREWLQTASDGMLDEMEAAGCTIVRDVDVAAFQEASAPVYEEYRDIIGSDLLDRALESLA